MRVGGIQKTSMIDYPGHISCVLFLSGCNFRCPYCHNPVLAKGGIIHEIEMKNFFLFLKGRQGFLDAVVISGGEPVLNPDLPDLCLRIHKMGFAVKLDTNGSRPDMLQLLIRQKCIDYIAMDIKSDWNRYSLLTNEKDIAYNLEKSISIILSSGISHEFRTTCVKPFVDLRAAEHMAGYITGTQRYFLQRFKKDTELLDPLFCTKDDCFLSEKELHDIMSVASKHVTTCILR